jgi:hypothetical protein
MENNLTPNENYTPEEIQRHIAAAFDSVDLINKLNELESLTEEQVSTKERNVEHLQIMMAKEWFANGLTEEQTTIINQLIS